MRMPAESVSQPMWVARRLFSIVRGILREIGDENAYNRYLHVHGLEASGDAWRAFSEQRMCAKYRKPKCC